MTAPLASVESTEQIDPLDDVFGSAPSSPTFHSQDSQTQRHLLDPSDIPRLRSTHVTNGYREGIAASKEKHIQEGFDEGYALGAELGMRVGWCLGVLEGVWNAAPTQTGDASQGRARADGSEKEGRVEREEVRKMLAQAEGELQVQCLFGKEYFGADGIWTYDVPDDSEAEEVTFRQVADAHPLLKKWMKIVGDLADGVGLELQ